jgi:hypothetical protein
MRADRDQAGALQRGPGDQSPSPPHGNGSAAAIPDRRHSRHPGHPGGRAFKAVADNTAKPAIAPTRPSATHGSAGPPGCRDIVRVATGPHCDDRARAQGDMDRGGNRGNRPQNLADHLLSSMPGVKHLAATVPGQQRRHPPLFAGWRASLPKPARRPDLLQYRARRLRVRLRPVIAPPAPRLDLSRVRCLLVGLRRLTQEI